MAMHVDSFSRLQRAKLVQSVKLNDLSEQVEKMVQAAASSLGGTRSIWASAARAEMLPEPPCGRPSKSVSHEGQGFVENEIARKQSAATLTQF